MGHTITLAAVGAVAFMVRQWPFALTLVDVAWGALAFAAAATVVWIVAR